MHFCQNHWRLETATPFSTSCWAQWVFLHAMYVFFNTLQCNLNSSVLPAGLPGTFPSFPQVLCSGFSRVQVLGRAPAVFGRNSQHPPAQSYLGGPQVSRVTPARAAQVGFQAAHLKPSVTGRSLATSTPGCSGNVTVWTWAIKSFVVGTSPSRILILLLSSRAASETTSR